MRHWIGSLNMPLAIVLGLVFPWETRWGGAWVSWGLGILLFFGFFRVDWNELRSLWTVEGRDERFFWKKIASLWFFAPGIWVLVLMVSQGKVAIIEPLLMVTLAPMATASPATAALLGLRLSWTLGWIFFSHVAVVLWIPLILGILHGEGRIAMAGAVFGKVMSGIAPLIFIPLGLAALARRRLKRIPWVAAWTQLIWFLVLYGVVSKASAQLRALHGWDRDLWLVGGSVLMLCLTLYGLGWKAGGARWGGEGALLLGQRNTVFALWVAQTYMAERNPWVVMGPLFYVFWQNALLSAWIAWSGMRRGGKMNGDG